MIGISDHRWGWETTSNDRENRQWDKDYTAGINYQNCISPAFQEWTFDFIASPYPPPNIHTHVHYTAGQNTHCLVKQFGKKKVKDYWDSFSN